jgi:hypothetical protein
MASPVIHSNGELAAQQVQRRLERRAAQQEASFRAAQRRRMVWTDVEEAEASSVLERVVLQKDFAQVVGSPTPGYVAVEVVIDPVTHAISIYAPP